MCKKSKSPPFFYYKICCRGQSASGASLQLPVTTTVVNKDVQNEMDLQCRFCIFFIYIWGLGNHAVKMTKSAFHLKWNLLLTFTRISRQPPSTCPSSFCKRPSLARSTQVPQLHGSWGTWRARQAWHNHLLWADSSHSMIAVYPFSCDWHHQQ